MDALYETRDLHFERRAFNSKEKHFPYYCLYDQGRPGDYEVRQENPIGRLHCPSELAGEKHILPLSSLGSRETPWIKEEFGRQREMVGSVGGIRNKADILHLTQNRDSMTSDDAERTFQNILGDQTTGLDVVRDPKSVDGVEHVIRTRGKSFDLRGYFPVIDRLNFDFTLVVGIPLSGSDLVFVDCDKLKGVGEFAGWFDPFHAAELTVLRDAHFRWEQRLGQE